MSRVRALCKHIPNGYVDFDEMLATEKGLDAVIVATPDHWHAEHTVKCLRAGLHVYCEKMMAHTLDGAREIAKAAEETGRVCQIGYQRRSNPRYRYTLEQLVQRHKRGYVVPVFPESAFLGRNKDRIIDLSEDCLAV